jgi:hypothetical protein
MKVRYVSNKGRGLTSRGIVICTAVEDGVTMVHIRSGMFSYWVSEDRVEQLPDNAVVVLQPRKGLYPKQPKKKRN